MFATLSGLFITQMSCITVPKEAYRLNSSLSALFSEQQCGRVIEAAEK